MQLSVKKDRNVDSLFIAITWQVIYHFWSLNEEIRDLTEHFDIEIKTTSRRLTKIIQKVKRVNGSDWHTALDWALMAKNNMVNVHGYSPHHLVFGQNPNFLSVLVNKPSALEGTTVSIHRS